MSNLELANNLGMELKNKTIVGEFDGYSLSITDYQMGYVKTKAAIFVFEKPLDKNIARVFQKQVKGITCMISSFKVQNDALVVVLPMKGLKNDEKYSEDLKAIFNQLTSQFKEMSFTQDNTCFLCGKDDSEEPLSKKLFRECYVPVHDSCANQLVKHVEQKVEEENLNSKRLPLSILLAVVGGIVGLIPTIITAFGFDRTFALLYILIPLGVAFGYRLGKAPRKKYMILIVILISVLLVIGFELLYLYIIAEGLPLLELLAIKEVYDAFISDLGLSLLFLALGIWVSWKYISNTSTQNVKEVENLK